MKIIIFDGRIGAKDAEVMTTRGGKPFIRFNVANNTFVNGQEKTEWFDVTSYDPFVIESKTKYLTKGTPVQIVGSLNTEVNVKEGKVWVNQHVTADRIELNFSGKRDDEKAPQETEEMVSTFTGGTRSEEFMANVSQTPKQTEATAKVEAQFADVDDDLPF